VPCPPTTLVPRQPQPQTNVHPRSPDKSPISRQLLCITSTLSHTYLDTAPVHSHPSLGGGSGYQERFYTHLTQKDPPHANPVPPCLSSDMAEGDVVWVWLALFMDSPTWYQRRYNPMDRLEEGYHQSSRPLGIISKTAQAKMEWNCMIAITFRTPAYSHLLSHLAAEGMIPNSWSLLHPVSYHSHEGAGLRTHSDHIQRLVTHPPSSTLSSSSCSLIPRPNAPPQTLSLHNLFGHLPRRCNNSGLGPNI